MPQYYSVAGQWVYPPIIQGGAGSQQRRPMSPSSAAPGDSAPLNQGPYLIPYIENGGFMMRGLGSGNMRLVSPAPVIAVNPATSGMILNALHFGIRG